MSTVSTSSTSNAEPALSVLAVHCSVSFCHMWMQIQAPTQHLQNPEYTPPAYNTVLSKVRSLVPQIIPLKGMLTAASEVLK